MDLSPETPDPARNIILRIEAPPESHAGSVNVNDLGTHYLEHAVREFRGLKALADGALRQTSDGDFFRTLDPDGNSIAIQVKHVAGNLRSRWTDFLTTDGEKPDRRRDSEFEREPADSRTALMQRWEDGWRILFDTLASLRSEQLQQTVLIRAEPHTVVQAVGRQMTHYGYHVGQIVQLARTFRGAAWTSLSIPRGGSKTFNAERGV
jgi:hypothetical protein